MKKIVVKEDIGAEVDIFLNFLHNKEYPQHRNMIFFHFPKLEEALGDNMENERAIVENFLKNTRENNKEKIDRATKHIQNEVEEKGERALTILADLMDYNWPSEGDDYILVPTILPISPFNRNTFFFSIYKSLEGNTEFPKVLAVSMHEISHMILFDLLKQKNIRLDNSMLYFVKELIAPIVVYQNDFGGVFKKDIVGNYNVLEIYFDVDGETIRAFDYFLKKFEDNRSMGAKFNVFLDDMLATCLQIDIPIKEKRNFDNMHGIKILKDPELLKKFREPIMLSKATKTE